VPGAQTFDVSDTGRCVGRIFVSPRALASASVVWTITAREYPRTIHSRGYSATREQAMKDFKSAVAELATTTQAEACVQIHTKSNATT
jgi:hypothetical protein